MQICGPLQLLSKPENLIIERIQTRIFVRPAKDVIVAHIALIALFSYAASFQTSLKWPFAALSLIYTISLIRRAQKKEIIVSIHRLYELSKVAQPRINQAPSISFEAKYFAKRGKFHPQIFFGFNEMAKDAYLAKHGKIILHPIHAKKID